MVHPLRWTGWSNLSLIRQPDTGLKAGERNNPEGPQFFCCCGVLQGSLLGLFLFLFFCHMLILTLGLDRARLSVSWRSWSSWLAQTPEWWQDHPGVKKCVAETNVLDVTLQPPLMCLNYSGNVSEWSIRRAPQYLAADTSGHLLSCAMKAGGETISTLVFQVQLQQSSSRQPKQCLTAWAGVGGSRSPSRGGEAVQPEVRGACDSELLSTALGTIRRVHMS